jgi:hypothetical protein
MSGSLSGYRTGAIDWRKRIFDTRAPGWSILVRLLVGLVVFLPEGIQWLFRISSRPVGSRISVFPFPS